MTVGRQRERRIAPGPDAVIHDQSCLLTVPPKRATERRPACRTDTTHSDAMCSACSYMRGAASAPSRRAASVSWCTSDWRAPRGGNGAFLPPIVPRSIAGLEGARTRLSLSCLPRLLGPIPVAFRRASEHPVGRRVTAPGPSSGWLGCARNGAGGGLVDMRVIQMPRRDLVMACIEVHSGIRCCPEIRAPSEGAGRRRARLHASVRRILMTTMMLSSRRWLGTDFAEFVLEGLGDIRTPQQSSHRAGRGRMRRASALEHCSTKGCRYMIGKFAQGRRVGLQRTVPRCAMRDGCVAARAKEKEACGGSMSIDAPSPLCSTSMAETHRQ